MFIYHDNMTENNDPEQDFNSDIDSEEDTQEVESEAQEEDFFLAAHGGEPQRVTTEAVLAYFGRERRGARLYREVQERLENLDLVMFPHIEDADYYGEVLIQRRPITGEDTGDAELVESVIVPVGSAPSETFDRQQRVLSLLKDDNDKLDYLTYDMTVEKAVAEMKQKGRTKMPLFFDHENKKNLIGTVTAEKIAFSEYDSPKIIDLAETRVPVVRTSEPLFDWVDTILENGFVYGKDADDEVVQIYTTADVAKYLNSITQMYLRLDELEEVIREVLVKIDEEEIGNALLRTKSLHAINLNSENQHLSDDEVKADDSDRGSHRAKRLTFGEYMKVIGDDTIWEMYFGSELPTLSKESCIRSLNDARKVRNRVAHNNRSESGSAIAVVDAVKAWLNHLMEKSFKQN